MNQKKSRVIFCRKCPIDKVTGERVYCKTCSNRQMNKLDRFTTGKFSAQIDREEE